MAQNEHINESILSDEVRQDMKKERIDHMTYLPGMEVLDSDIGQQVLDRTAAYDYNRYTAEDVRRALRHENRTLEDFGALLSPAALPFLEEIAQYILYKGVIKMNMQEKINKQFEKVSNELGKTILGDMQEEFIGKRKDIVKFLLMC